MKGECEGRELTPGAPVRVGAGVVPEHSREGASGRIEAGVKSDSQDISTRGFQMPAVVGVNQGNGTRGFTVAELTKVDNIASPLGNLQIPSVKDGAIGSYRVPSFGENYHGRALANLGETHIQGWSDSRTTANLGDAHIPGWSENRATPNFGDAHIPGWSENRATTNLAGPHIQGWSESRATGAFKIPGFHREGPEHSGALNLTRVSHDITSQSLQDVGVQEEDQGGSIKALSNAQQKGDGHSSSKGTLRQDCTTGSSSFINTKREAPKSAAERNFMGTSKRLKPDGGGMKPLEAVIKRLKQDACAAVTTAGKRVTESNSMISSDVAAVQRPSQDGASGVAVVTDVETCQDSTTEAAGATPMVTESPGCVQETVNGACFRNLNQEGSTSTEDIEGTGKEGQDSLSAKEDLEKLNQGTGTESGPAETTKTEVSTKGDVEKLNQGTGSEFGHVETTKVDVLLKTGVEKLNQGTGTEFGHAETTKVDISAKGEAEELSQGTQTEFGHTETTKVDVLAKTDVGNLNQGTFTEFGHPETTKVDDSAKEDVKKIEQDAGTDSEQVEAMMEDVSAKDVEKIDQGCGTEFGQAETMTVEEQNNTISTADSVVKECLQGNSLKGDSLNSPEPPEKQEIGSSSEENLSVPPMETINQIHTSESSAAPDKEKEGLEALDRSTGDAAGPCVKNETQDCPAEKPSIQEEEQQKDKDGEKLLVSKQESEEKESKQENSLPGGGEGVAKECVGDASESKVPDSDPSKALSAKPKMVSIETQCDSSGMGPITSAEDDHTSASDDGGVPGECLGACEPGRKPHKCYQCETSFRTPYELSRHSRVHSGERPYQCRLCHRCFKRKDHVEVHTRRHVEDRRHICGLCGVCFVTSSCLLRHQRRTHQGVGGKWTAEGEEEGEGEVGDTKGECRDQPTSKDAQRNGRRNKKNKPDTTYRPGGRTVCIIKKRNLRQRSYSFVELEDDVECFESDEEDRIPFLKVQEQRQEEEREEFGGQTGQLDHSLFPGSLFSSEASLGHLLLLGEVSRLLSHSLIPEPLELTDGESNVETMAEQPLAAEAKENEADSDDSDCGPPLVACDVTIMEGEGEVAGLSQPDDGPATPTNPEEATAHKEEDKPASQVGPCQVTLKGEPCQTTPGGKDTRGTISPPQPPLGESKMAKPSQPCTGPSSTPPISGRPAASATNNKLPGTGVGAMGVPRTAWVVPANNTKGKNTCDACRRRNEANRLAQLEKERQAQAAQDSLKQAETKVEETPQSCPEKVETKDPPKAPPSARPPVKPQKLKPSASKRGKKASNAKKRRQAKPVAVAEGAAAALQRPHKCHLCPFNFRSATELKRHASTHSGERPFLCELCGAGFVRKCHLQLHVRRHSGERRHACQECRMRFFTPSDLARHQAIHQVGDKPLECHLCHLTFRRAFHLERHIRRHNDAAPFACKLCGAFFSSAAALRSHDKHHRTPGPHACPDCTAAFTTATALSRHRRVHSARHHRLLRAVERHATAKSSYECVSSEESPLSLVIRKVAATTGGSGEGGNGPTKESTGDVPSDPANGGEEEEEEGRKVDISTLPASMETEEGEKSASSHSTTAAEGEGRPEGGENVASSPSSISKDKDSENITSSPSIAEQMINDSKMYTSTPPSTVKAKEEPQNLTSFLSSLDSVNSDSEKTASMSMIVKEEEESDLFPSITDLAYDGKLMGREDVTSLLPTPSKETGAKWNRNSDSHKEETTAAEEDPYDFNLTASEIDEGFKSSTFSLSSKSITKRNKRSHDDWSKFSSTNSGKEICSNSIPSFYTTDRQTEHIEELEDKAIKMEMQHIEESGNITTCSPANNEGKAASGELEGRPGCGISAVSTETKEGERGGICSFLAPTSREAEAVKEIHCRTTYHLTAPSGDPGSTVHAGSGFPSEQEGSRGSSQDGGQSSNVREGVATTS